MDHDEFDALKQGLERSRVGVSVRLGRDSVPAVVQEVISAFIAEMRGYVIPESAKITIRSNPRRDTRFPYVRVHLSAFSRPANVRLGAILVAMLDLGGIRYRLGSWLPPMDFQGKVWEVKRILVARGGVDLAANQIAWRLVGGQAWKLQLFFRDPAPTLRQDPTIPVDPFHFAGFPVTTAT